MSAQENAALVRKAYELWNARDFDGELALAAEDVEVINVATGERFQGRDQLRRFLEGWSTAFPDSQVEVTRVIAGDDGAVVEFTGRGTHDGPLQTPAGPIPATGRPIEIHFCDVHQIRDGRLVRQHTYFDSATLIRQVGLIK